MRGTLALLLALIILSIGCIDSSKCEIKDYSLEEDYPKLSKMHLLGTTSGAGKTPSYSRMLDLDELSLEEAKQLCNALNGHSYFECIVDLSVKAGEELCYDIPVKRQKEELSFKTLEGVETILPYTEYKDACFEQDLCLEHARSKGLNQDNFVLLVFESNLQRFFEYSITENFLGEKHSYEDSINLNNIIEKKLLDKDDVLTQYLSELVFSLAGEEQNPEICDYLDDFTKTLGSSQECRNMYKMVYGEK